MVCPNDRVQESPSKKGRVRPEDFVCQTVEELIQWIDATIRHSARRHHRQCNGSQQVGRFDGRWNRAVEELDIESIDVKSHGGVNFEHLQVQSPRRVQALCVFRGIRVGEAAQPWASVVESASKGKAQCASVGNVVRCGTVFPTVPATPGALVEVGKEPPLDQAVADILDALAVYLEADDDARSLDEKFGPEVFPLTTQRWRCLNDAASQTCTDAELLEGGEALGSIDDTESVTVQDGGSEISEDETLAPASVPDLLVTATTVLTPAIRAVLEWLDEVDFDAVFIRRAVVMKTVPKFLRGPYRSAVRSVMEEADHENDQRERGWKLFLLLPRLLLFRHAGGGNIHKGKLAQRFQDFSEGRWSELLRVSTQSAEDAPKA